VKILRLGDVVEGVNTWNPNRDPDAEFTYVDLSAIDNVKKAITSPAVVTGREAPSRARQLIKTHDVLVSTVRPNLNAVALVAPELDGATASTGFTVLRPTDRVEFNYLFHWVRTPRFVSDMVRKATGASYPAVSDRIVKDSLIPLPPLDEQRRIAAILDQVDRLRAQRAQVVDRLRVLISGLFIEAFGEQLDGPASSRLDEIAEISSGITKGRKTTGPTSLIPYLAVVNVQAGHLVLDPLKEIGATEAEIERYSLKDGDLVLTEGGDPDKLGRGTVWRCEVPLCLHQNHIFRVRIRPESKVKPDYLSAYLASRPARSYFLRAAKQTTGIASINMTQLRGLPVLVPPLPDQRQFLEQVGAVTRQLESCARQSAEIDQLWRSLQSCAFSGKL